MRWIWLALAFLRVVQSSEYNLSVATIFKDEAPYLKEWIEYNKMIGVQHFRLYNNDSTDDYMSVLAPYIAAGEVDLIDWPSSAEDLENWCNNTQWPQCQDAIRHFAGKTKWLALIDVDEYLLPLEHATISEFLKGYEEYPGVLLNWQCFGTSFVKTIPKDRLMIEMLTMKAEDLSVRNFPVKSIVRPELVDTNQMAWAPHTYNYTSESEAVFPDHTIRLEGFPQDLNEEEILERIHPTGAVVNHYVHRAEDYFWGTKLEKKERMEKGVISTSYVDDWYIDCNAVEDQRIFRFIPELKKRVFAKDDFCMKYQRPFTLFSWGVDEDHLVEDLAKQYPNSVFVIFGQRSDLLKPIPDNIIVLQHIPTIEEYQRIASCEHADITLFFEEPEPEYFDVAKSMSHQVIIDGVSFTGEPSFYLVRTSYIHPIKLRRTYEILCDYNQKILRKTRSDGQRECEWVPGINMMTYALFDGRAPSRVDLINQIPLDYQHRDFVPNNMIIQGRRVVLIDGDDPLSGPIPDDDGGQIRRLNKLAKRFLSSTEGLDPEQVRSRFLSIYDWEEYFQQTEIDE